MTVMVSQQNLKHHDRHSDPHGRKEQILSATGVNKSHGGYHGRLGLDPSRMGTIADFLHKEDG